MPFFGMRWIWDHSGSGPYINDNRRACSPNRPGTADRRRSAWEADPTFCYQDILKSCCAMKKYQLKTTAPLRPSIDYASHLNPEQLAAVTSEDGASLVIAGAGSGKTRVVTYRVERQGS
jgi:hypothetical protein